MGSNERPQQCRQAQSGRCVCDGLVWLPACRPSSCTAGLRALRRSRWVRWRSPCCGATGCGQSRRHRQQLLQLSTCTNPWGQHPRSSTACCCWLSPSHRHLARGSWRLRQQGATCLSLGCAIVRVGMQLRLSVVLCSALAEFLRLTVLLMAAATGSCKRADPLCLPFHINCTAQGAAWG
jgi:hypothetical protein